VVCRTVLLGFDATESGLGLSRVPAALFATLPGVRHGLGGGRWGHRLGPSPSPSPIPDAGPGSPAAVPRVSAPPRQGNKLIPALAFLKESLQHFSSFLSVLMRRISRRRENHCQKCQSVLVILLKLLEQQQQQRPRRGKEVGEEGSDFISRSWGGWGERCPATALLPGRVPDKITP